MHTKTILIAAIVIVVGLGALILFLTAGRGSAIYVPDQAAKHLEKGSFFVNKRRHTVDRAEKADLLSKAMHEFEKALEAKPDFEVAHNMMGHCYIERGMWDAALKHLNRAIALRPNYPAALYNRGLVYRKLALGKRDDTFVDKAISDYLTAMQSELSAAIGGDLLKALAEAHHEKNDLASAIDYYKKYLNKAPHAQDAQLISRKIHGLTLMHKGNTP